MMNNKMKMRKKIVKQEKSYRLGKTKTNKRRNKVILPLNNSMEFLVNFLSNSKEAIYIYFLAVWQHSSMV